MIPNPDETIVALASAPGPGMRGIIRLSGPNTRQIVAAVLESWPNISGGKRWLRHCSIRIPGVYSPLPADLHFATEPRTYTGQDTAELHTISSPPLLDALITALLNGGARAALPGEFTLRAFLAGKKDLPQAEAVRAVVEASTPDELRQALVQLAGGVTQPLHGLREDLLNLLADVEAGLDFVDEDIAFVDKTDMLLRVGKGIAQVMLLQKQLHERSLSDRPFRVALVGAPNAGKSSLFNALAGLPVAIVSPVAGTTRDYLTRTVQLKGTSIELIDTAGWQAAGTTIEQQAQALGKAQARSADLLVWCCEVASAVLEIPSDFGGLPVLTVQTKSDRTAQLPDDVKIGIVATSAKTGSGIAELKALLGERALHANRGSLASSLSRCRHHVEASLKHLRAAHAIVLFDDPAELLALELRLALEQIGEMIGAVHSEDLLDRVFSRFCIGK
jgi:tRNA modification GTPase